MLRLIIITEGRDHIRHRQHVAVHKLQSQELN